MTIAESIVELFNLSPYCALSAVNCCRHETQSTYHDRLNDTATYYFPDGSAVILQETSARIVDTPRKP